MKSLIFFLSSIAVRGITLDLLAPFSPLELRLLRQLRQGWVGAIPQVVGPEKVVSLNRPDRFPWCLELWCAGTSLATPS